MSERYLPRGLRPELLDGFSVSERHVFLVAERYRGMLERRNAAKIKAASDNNLPEELRILPSISPQRLGEATRHKVEAAIYNKYGMSYKELNDRLTRRKAA